MTIVSGRELPVSSILRPTLECVLHDLPPPGLRPPRPLARRAPPRHPGLEKGRRAVAALEGPGAARAPPCSSRAQPAQQESSSTERVKVWAQSLSPSTIVR